MAHGKRSIRGIRGNCPSGKLRFATRKAALESLARAKRDPSPKRAEYREYLCDRCGGFHLASHEPGPRP